jgi:hypothetical protein
MLVTKRGNITTRILFFPYNKLTTQGEIIDHSLTHLSMELDFFGISFNFIFPCLLMIWIILRTK